MSNYIKAKELLSSNIGGAIKVILLTLLIAMISGFFSIIPFIGWIIAIIASIYTIIFELYSLKKVVVDKEDASFTQLINETIPIFQEKGWKTFVAYLVMTLCLIPIMMLATLLLLLPIINMVGATSEVAFFTSFLSSILMFIPFILIIVFFLYYFSYRLYYKVVGYIFDVESSPILAKHNWDMVKMSLILTFIIIIPFVGWIIAIIIDYIYMVKVILDITEADKIEVEITE